MRVLLAGGGSGGSATPVLAVAEALRSRQPDVELLYVGTHGGPERILAEAEGVPFVGVSSGKLRRYWSGKNVTDVVRVGVGLIDSVRLVRRFRPDVAFGAGGFASVPPLVAASLVRTPVLIHQQDVLPGLANRLLVPFADRITVAMPPTLKRFPSRRTALRGNPVRRRILEARADQAVATLGLQPDVPLLLVTGGGTGALALNRVVAEAAPRLVQFAQVLHLSGRGRGVEAPALGRRYEQREFLVDEFPAALAAASLVMTRAGMSTLSELAVLGKPALVVPMPASHQEANARAFADAGGVLVADQRTLTADRLVSETKALLDDDDRRRNLSAAIAALMPRDAADRIADDLATLATSRHAKRRTAPSHR